MLKVLITGVTGFLGSHIAESFLKSDNIQIIGLKRKNSDLWRCEKFGEKIQWIVIDEEGEYKEAIVDLKPDVIIHCAWIGVESKDRDNWDIQKNNIDFLLMLLHISNSLELKKFIFLGSQAEYGSFSEKIKETATSNPNNAYSFAKSACLEILKSFACKNNFVWLWLRVFSIFGEREASNWLLPSLIKTMQSSNEMDLTKGEQHYAYLYVKDFAKILYKIGVSELENGIYNISSNKTIAIKDFVIKIRDEVNPEFKLNFGKIAYRESQSMHMEGDIEKIQKQIGKIDFTEFEMALKATIKTYI